MGITLQWVSVTQSNLCGTFKKEMKYNIFLLQSKGSKVREYLCGLFCSAGMHCRKRDHIDEVPEKENLKTMQLVKYYDIFFIKVLFCFLTIYFYKLKKVNVCWLFIPCTYVLCMLYVCRVCPCTKVCVCTVCLWEYSYTYVCMSVRVCCWEILERSLTGCWNQTFLYIIILIILTIVNNVIILFWFLYIFFFCYLKMRR